MAHDLPVAGWHEVIALPQLGVESAFAKIDTGADSSTLHATDIRIVGQADDQRVEFTAPLLRSQHSCADWPFGGVRRVSAPLVAQRTVRSSNGEDELRVRIRTDLRIGTITINTCFTLTNREGLRFPVLIGRDALAGNFVVDASRAHLLRPAPDCPD